MLMLDMLRLSFSIFIRLTCWCAVSHQVVLDLLRNRIHTHFRHNRKRIDHFDHAFSLESRYQHANRFLQDWVV